MIVGSILCVSGIIWHEVYVRLYEKCFFNLMHVAFFAALIALSCYWVISLLTCRKPQNPSGQSGDPFKRENDTPRD